MDCLSYAALALWYLGYPDQALKRSQEAITLAQELSHPFSLVVALIFAAWLHQFRRERQAIQERAESGYYSSRLSRGFHSGWRMENIFRGWALAEQGKGEEGIAQIQPRLSRLPGHGSRGRTTVVSGHVGEAYEKVGQIAEGLTAAGRGLWQWTKLGRTMHEAELYRLKGELLICKSRSSPQTPRVREAEECFLKAIEIARQQQAKSLELRAVMSLSRLWQQQGKQEEAHKLLSEIYNWFTEGFDTKDLQEAKALLEELT